MNDRLTASLPSLPAYRQMAADCGAWLGAHYVTDEAVTAVVEASAVLADGLGARDVAYASITPGDMTRYDIVVSRIMSVADRRALGGAGYVATFPNASRGCAINLDGGLVHVGYLAGAAGLLDRQDRPNHAALIFAGVLSLLADRLHPGL